MILRSRRRAPRISTRDQHDDHRREDAARRENSPTIFARFALEKSPREHFRAIDDPDEELITYACK